MSRSCSASQLYSQALVAAEKRLFSDKVLTAGANKYVCVVIQVFLSIKQIKSSGGLLLDFSREIYLFDLLERYACGRLFTNDTCLSLC